MKKLLLLLVGVGMLHVSGYAQFRLGPEIGLNVSNINQNASSLNTGSGASISSITSLLSSYTNNYGLRVGVNAEYSFSESFALQSGLYYSMMGASTNAQSLSFSGLNISLGAGSVRLNYLHVPVYAVYKVDAGSGKFVMGAGPFISYCLSGTTNLGAIKLDTLGTFPASSTAISFGSDSSSIKALDYGIGMMAGYEMANGLYFKVGYNYSLQNISNANGTTEKNSCFFVSAAWYFSNKKKD